jgi:hypothetical protein
MNISRFVAVAVVAGVLLSGCAPDDADSRAPIAAPPTVTATPTATPEPTKPALDQLVVSPEGLGSVVIGKAPVVADPTLDIIVLDPDYCQEFVDDGRLDEAAKWIANYEPALSGTSFEPFSVLVENGVVETIAVGSSEILTAEGVGLGSSRADVLAAYPDAELITAFASDMYVIDGEYGQVVIEVATEKITGSVDESAYPIDEVGSLRVIDASIEPLAWANTDAGSFANCLRA